MNEQLQRFFGILHRCPTHRARAIDNAYVLFRLINNSLCQKFTIGLDMNELNHLAASVTKLARINTVWFKQLGADAIVMLEVNIKLYILRIVFELLII